MKKNKIFLALLVNICSLCFALCFTACSEPDNSNHKSDATPINALSYKLNDDDASYTVSGLGTYSNADLVIPATYNDLPVTSIGSNSFNNTKSIKTVTIPETVTNIKEYAFNNCTSLESVMFSEGLVSIDNGAFNGCTSLTTITVPGSVNKISNKAFYGCTSLESVNIENGVSVIGSNVFHSCTSLKQISIPDSITTIGGSVFYGCPLKFNEYDNGLYLGNDNNRYLVLIQAVDQNILNCNINQNTKFIYSEAFSGCSLLSEIVIPDGVIEIGSYSFSNCTSLTTVTIPLSVTDISSFTFENCSSLSTIEFEGTAAQWENVNKLAQWNYNAALFYVIFNG